MATAVINWIRRAGLFALTLVIMAALLCIAIIVFEGKQKPDSSSRYVALGSSFAAGIGLGERAPDSPLACRRSVNGYPQQLARLTKISLGDMTCSGATIKHVLHGGQFFQGPQIDAIGQNAELVTLTAGGNDISYIGDLLMLSYRQRGGVAARIINRFWHGAKPVEDRQFAQLQSNMVDTLQEISHRAPQARIVVVTYPMILPPEGTCAQIGISTVDAATMRDVAAQLAEITRSAAKVTGASVVDMAALSVGHDACSTDPWVSGAESQHGAPFHPTLAGAQATAEQIMLVLNANRVN